MLAYDHAKLTYLSKNNAMNSGFSLVLNDATDCIILELSDVLMLTSSIYYE